MNQPHSRTALCPSANGLGREHLGEEELFELALDASGARANCAACDARIQELRASLATLRSAALGAGTHERAREQALIQRVLSATVGADLSWRGDVRLIVRFARERLRASVWVRAAAALLVLHLGALPVLAWIVLRAERAPSAFQSQLEPLPRESLFADEPEAPLEQLTETSTGEPTLVEQSPEIGDGAREGASGVEQALALERAALRAFRWPVADASNRPSDAFGLRLWARSRVALHGEAPPAWTHGNAAGAQLEALLALELELELDRLAQGASPIAAQALAQRLHQQWRPQTGLGELARLALARAARLGAIEPSPAAEGALREQVFGRAWQRALAEAAPTPAGEHVRTWLRATSR
jgi:hypothetical protein